MPQDFRGLRRRRLFVVLEGKEGKMLSIELTLLLVGCRCVALQRGKMRKVF